MVILDSLDQSAHLAGKEFEEEMVSKVPQDIQDPKVHGDHQ